MQWMTVPILLTVLAVPEWGAGATCPPLTPGGNEEVDHCPHVFRLVCEAPGGQRTLTAFRSTADARTGLITALHGVVGCDRLRARNIRGGPDALSLVAADISLDVALLTGKGSLGDEIPPAARWTDTGVRVVGYPTGIVGQYAHDLTLDSIGLRPLYRIMQPASQRAIETRGSPSLEAQVISLAGPLSSGYSGAPILNRSGEVLGVAFGGNAGGVAQVGFASPLSAVKWRSVDEVPDTLNRLAQLASTGMFSDAIALAEPPKPLPPLLITDARDPEGRILRVENGRFAVFYRWGKNTIFNIAWHPAMGLLFSNANDFDLNAVSGGVTTTHFRHNTYLRDVAVEPIRNDIFFSEATGGGQDGIIYRLRNGAAEPYRRIRLSEVDGYWAGDFAFDPDGFIWLSSGNRAPANLYKLDGDTVVRFFSSPQPIKGFAFIDRETVVYADWKQRLYQLSLRDLSVREAGRFGTVEWMGDVTVPPK
jgi:hypothetical protein